MSKLELEAVSRKRHMRRHYPDDSARIWSTNVEYGHVVGLRTPQGEHAANRFALSAIARLRYPDMADAVEFDKRRALRFSLFFMNLHRGHPLQCHDLVEFVEGATPGDSDWRQADTAAPIESGRVYAVFLSRAIHHDGNWQNAHSCIGTDNQKLLGLNGAGGELMLTDMETTLRLFGYGAPHVTLGQLE